MNNRSRKSLLTRAAARSANRKIRRGVASFAEYGGLVTGYEDGYKAAARDLTKELKDPSKHFAVVVREFVRPIR